MDHKFVGILNLLAGLIQLILSVSQAVFVVPRMMELYEQFETPGPNLFVTYVTLAIIFILGISNLFCFYFLIFGKPSIKQHFFIPALILIGASGLLMGIAIAISVNSIIAPMYMLTESF